MEVFEEQVRNTRSQIDNLTNSFAIVNDLP